jgi:hypothetical protein
MAGVRPTPLIGLSVAVVFTTACGPDVPPEFQPDETLRVELGLTDDDEVHRVSLFGGDREEINPAELALDRPSWVEFVSTDWRVHEVRFEVDSLTSEAAEFLRATDQVASSLLVEMDARFVVSFHEAPVGRYPYVVEGNGLPGRGVVVVQPKR